MKDKIFITLIILGILVISIFTGMYIYKIFNKHEEKLSSVKQIDNKIVESRENTLNLENETISTNSSEEKITPNTKLILKKYYEQCGHSINEYVEMPPELINMTKEELEEEYNSWNINIFSEDKVILIKTVNNFCNEHYSLKELDGYVAIYKIDKDGKETFQEKTSISTRYLTETDKSHLQSEIKIYGTENLNKYIEDFE